MTYQIAFLIYLLTGSAESSRAESLMRLERDLFSRWCNLVFRGSMGNGPIKNFEDGLDKVRRLSVAAASHEFYLC